MNRSIDEDNGSGNPSGLQMHAKQLPDQAVLEIRSPLTWYKAIQDRGSAVRRQKEIDGAIASLKEHLSTLVSLQSRINPGTKLQLQNQSSDQENDDSQEKVYLDNINSSYQGLFEAILNLPVGSNTEQEPKRADQTQMFLAIKSLNLKRKENSQLNEVQTERIVGLKTAIMDFKDQLSNYNTSQSGISINHQSTDPLEIKNSILVQDETYKTLSDEKKDRVATIHAISNVVYKIQRDFDGLMVIQDIDPNSFKDEKEQKEEKSIFNIFKGSAAIEGSKLLFNPSLIKRPSQDYINNKIKQMKSCVQKQIKIAKRLGQIQQNIQDSMNLSQDRSQRSQNDENAQQCQEISSRIKGFHEQLRSFLRLDPSAEETAHREEKLLSELEDEEEKGLHEEHRQENRKDSSKIVAAVNAFDLTKSNLAN